MSNLTAFNYNGQVISRRENGFVNLTQMCQANGKRLDVFMKTQKTKDYIECLERSHQMVVTEIVQGGEPDLQGTWGHPSLAINLARWISPVFAVWCDGHIFNLLSTGSTAIASQQPPQPQLPERDTIDYITAASALEKLADSTLKSLLKDSLIDEIELRRNIKALSESDRPNPKKYTIAKVRAKMLGYSPEEIGNGTGLGKFIHSQIKPSFREFVGKYPVYHYEVTPEFDEAIHAYFSARRRSV